MSRGDIGRGAGIDLDVKIQFAVQGLKLIYSTQQEPFPA
jgi:hypothetical protein